jgi:hypothetical protein
MKKIRKGVHETNSSSCHSLTIESTTSLMDTIIPDGEGVVTIKPGDYGWQWERFNNAYTKASYCLTGVQYVSDKEGALTNLKEVIQKHTLCEKINLIDGHENTHAILQDYDDEDYGYIDHQSTEDGEMNNLLFDKEKLHNFIFNKNSWLFLGNDNSSPPNKFYDTDGLKYSWKLTFPEYPSITEWEFINYPDDEEILEAISDMGLRFERKGSKYKVKERPHSWSTSSEYFQYSHNSKVDDKTISFFSDKNDKVSLLVNYQLVEIKE